MLCVLLKNKKNSWVLKWARLTRDHRFLWTRHTLYIPSLWGQSQCVVKTLVSLETSVPAESVSALVVALASGAGRMLATAYRAKVFRPKICVYRNESIWRQRLFATRLNVTTKIRVSDGTRNASHLDCSCKEHLVSNNGSIGLLKNCPSEGHLCNIWDIGKDWQIPLGEITNILRMRWPYTFWGSGSKIKSCQWWIHINV